MSTIALVPQHGRRTIGVSVGGGVVQWTARRVELDHRARCGCGAPRRVVSERAIVAGDPLPQWVVVSDRCSAAC